MNLDIIAVGVNVAFQFLTMCIAGSVLDDVVFDTGIGNAASYLVATHAILTFTVAVPYFAVWLAYRHNQGAFLSLGLFYGVLSFVLFAFGCKGADVGDPAPGVERDGSVKALEAFAIITGLIGTATVGAQIAFLSAEFKPQLDLSGGGGGGGSAKPSSAKKDKDTAAVVPSSPEDA